jgi:hypothetical protein
MVNTVFQITYNLLTPVIYLAVYMAVRDNPASPKLQQLSGRDIHKHTRRTLADYRIIIGNTRFQVSRHKHKKVMETIKREGFMAFLLQNRQIISFLW